MQTNYAVSFEKNLLLFSRTSVGTSAFPKTKELLEFVFVNKLLTKIFSETSVLLSYISFFSYSEKHFL